MSELPINVRITSEGADVATSKFDSLFEVMRKGNAVSQETMTKANDLRSELSLQANSLYTLRYAFMAAHPAALLFTQALSAVGSVARMAVGMLNSLNLLMLTLTNTGDKLETAELGVERAQRNYQLALEEFGTTAVETIDAFEDLQEALNKLEDAERDAKQESTRTKTQFALLGVMAATVVPSQLMMLWEKLSSLKMMFGATAGAKGAGLLSKAFGGIGKAAGKLAGVLASPIVWAGIVVAGLALSAYLYSIGEDFDSIDAKANELFKDFDKTVSTHLEAFSDAVDDFVEAVVSGSIIRIAETAPLQILAIFGRLAVLVLEGIGRLTLAVLEGIGKLTMGLLIMIGKLTADTIIAFIDFGVGFMKWLNESIYNAMVIVWDTVYGWGASIVEYLADGIRSAISSVADAAASVASTITDFLGIGSPAKKGPLAGLMEWGPNLVNTYAEGVEGNAGRMNNAMGTLLGSTGTSTADTIGALSTGGRGGGGRALTIGSINITAPASKEMAQEISRAMIIELNRYMRWT